MTGMPCRSSSSRISSTATRRACCCRTRRSAIASQTFDLEVVHRRAVGGMHRLTYGGNVRRVGFDVDIAAAAEDRLEAAGFLQDEIDTERYRAVLAARVDKFGNIGTPFVSPRIAVGVKFGPDHVLTGSWNRAFRAPSAVEAFMDQTVVMPIDLSALRALGPVLPLFVPEGLSPEARAAALARLEGQLDATTSRPFPLQTRAIGGDIPLGGDGAPGGFVQEAVTAYELSYSGSFAGGRATFGAAAYVSDVSDSIGLVPVAAGVDPYTAEAPPPGWVLPPEVLTFLGSFGACCRERAWRTAIWGRCGRWVREVWLEGRLLRSGSGVGQLLVAGSAVDSGRGGTVPGDGAQLAAGASDQRRGGLGWGALRRQRVGQRVDAGVLVGRADVGVPRVFGRIRAGERDGRGEMERRFGHYAGAGDESAESEHPAACVRGPASAVGDRGGAVGAVAAHAGGRRCVGLRMGWCWFRWGWCC